MVPRVSGIWDAVTGGNSGREALLAIRRGMQLFREVKRLVDVLLCCCVCMCRYEIQVHDSV